MSASVKETWGQAYLQAVLEVDGQKMPQRILAARGAVAERLRDLEGSSDHHAERHEIETALASLTVIEKEAKNWQ
jgi:hypothetical protein